MLQRLIVRNYSGWIIGGVCVWIVYLLDIFDTGPDPTWPTQDGECCDPTRPKPTDPTRPMHGWARPMSNSESIYALYRSMSAVLHGRVAVEWYEQPGRLPWTVVDLCDHHLTSTVQSEAPPTLPWTVLRTTGRHVQFHEPSLRDAIQRFDLAPLQLQRRSLGASRPHFEHRRRRLRLFQQHFRLRRSARFHWLDLSGWEYDCFRSDFDLHL